MMIISHDAGAFRLYDEAGLGISFITIDMAEVPGITMSFLRHVLQLRQGRDGMGYTGRYDMTSEMAREYMHALCVKYNVAEWYNKYPPGHYGHLPHTALEGQGYEIMPK